MNLHMCQRGAPTATLPPRAGGGAEFLNLRFCLTATARGEFVGPLEDTSVSAVFPVSGACVC